MTHLYIELNTGLTEEVNSSIISKLYELAISGDLDNTSDLKGRLHSSTAKEKHVTYLNNNFDELYISADILYLSFDDPDVETLMKRYIGTSDGVSLLDVQTFVNSGTAFGNGYTNTHTNRSGDFCINNEEKASINTFDEINLFNGLTSLGNNVFNTSNLTSIQLPSSITTLGGAPFGNCNSLRSVTGLSNITSVSSGCFYNCSNLDNTDLNFANLISLELQAFYNCTSYPFGDLNLSSATSIGKEVFRQCTGITKLTLNDNVSITGDNVFWHCTNMTQADLGSGITFTSNGHSMFAGCTGLTTVTGMSDVTTIPQFMFADCTHLTSVDIDWSKITHIYGSAFQGASSLAISNLSIPNLIELRDNTFKLSGLISISDLGSILKISGGTFYGCANLVSVVLPNTLTYIEYDAFRECPNLQHVNIPSSCTDLGQNCFYSCNKLDETYDLSNLTIVRSGIFNNCTKVKVSNFPRVSSYASSAFYGIGNTTITIPKEVTSIGGACFRNLLGLLSVTFELNSQLTNIEYDGFAFCPLLQSMILPEGLTTIGNNCFNSCDKLHYLELPSTLTRLNNGQGIGMYNNSADDTIIVFNGTTPPDSNAAGVSLFGQRILSTLYIYVPDASIQTYKAHTAFSLYADRIFGISQLPQS